MNNCNNDCNGNYSYCKNICNNNRKKCNIHLSQRYPIVEVVADVRIQLQHKVWNTGRVFVDDEVGWVVQENVIYIRDVSSRT